MSATTIDEHIAKIHEWIEEACAENPDVYAGDVESDVLTSYISAEIVGGERSQMANIIRRRFGR